MRIAISVFIAIVAAVAALIGLWGGGVRDSRLTGWGMTLLALIILGALFEISKEIVDTLEKRRVAERHRREREAERHWGYLEAQRFQRLKVSLYVRNPAEVRRFVELVSGIHLQMHLDEGESVDLGTLLDFPQLRGEPYTSNVSTSQSADRERPMAWLWELYDREPGYWWKATSHRWTAVGRLAAGVDAEIPWERLGLGNTRTLRDLASIPHFGVTVPWQMVKLELEEISLQFCLQTDSLDFDFSEQGLAGLKWLQDEQAKVGTSEHWLPLGIKFSGQHVLDVCRDSFLKRALGDSKSKAYRGIMGLSGPMGREVCFFPSMPMGFSKSPEAKDYAFTVVMPPTK